MKKRFCSIMLVCLIIFVSVMGCAQNSDKPTGEPIVGGYTEDREITAEDLSIFEETTAGLDGVSYEPKLVATQVVAGTNYRFTASATDMVPGAEPYDVYVYIFAPLNGTPELTEIVPVEGG